MVKAFVIELWKILFTFLLFIFFFRRGQRLVLVRIRLDPLLPTEIRGEQERLLFLACYYSDTCFHGHPKLITTSIEEASILCLGTFHSRNLHFDHTWSLRWFSAANVLTRTWIRTVSSPQAFLQSNVLVGVRGP